MTIVCGNGVYKNLEPHHELVWDDEAWSDCVEIRPSDEDEDIASKIAERLNVWKQELGTDWTQAREFV
jgi:hypothetical protein